MRTLAARMLKPFLPSTCIVVLSASTGMRKMRKAPAAAEAQAVLTGMGRLRVDSDSSSSVSTPALAAVSPKRLMGPWISAGPTPR